MKGAWSYVRVTPVIGAGRCLAARMDHDRSRTSPKARARGQQQTKPIDALVLALDEVRLQS